MHEWATIVGPLHVRICLERITDDATLIVGVHDTHWMQELYYLSHELRDTINTALGKAWVKHIKFVMSKRLRVKQPHGRRLVQLTIAEKKKSAPQRRPLSPKQLAALRAITDVELRESLSDLLGMST